MIYIVYLFCQNMAFAAGAAASSSFYHAIP